MVQRKDYMLTGLSNYETFDFKRFFEDYELRTVGGVVRDGKWRSSAQLIPKRSKTNNKEHYIVTVIVPKVDRETVDAMTCESILSIHPDTLNFDKLRVSYRSYGFQLTIEDELALFDETGHSYLVRPQNESKEMHFDVKPEDGEAICSKKGMLS